MNIPGELQLEPTQINKTIDAIVANIPASQKEAARTAAGNIATMYRGSSRALNLLISATRSGDFDSVANKLLRDYERVFKPLLDCDSTQNHELWDTYCQTLSDQLAATQTQARA